MIKSFVRGQSLQIAQPLVVTGTLNYIEMKVDFKTSDWDGLSKWVHFRNESGEEIPPQNLNSDNMLTKDNEIDLTTGIWTVWIHGTSPSEDGLEVTRITTNEATITVENTGMDGDHPLPPVAPDVTEQLDSKIQNAVKVSNEAKQTADEALRKVQEVSPMVDDTKKYAESAKNSAEAASTSETNSKTSETNASKSEANAKKYAEFAKKSEINSKNSENSAKTYADNAKLYSESTKLDADNSSESARQARISEDNAKKSADEAKAYEENAKKSADAAKSSESKVSEDATSAALSATNAKHSEVNAKTSETNAANSETNADIYAKSADLSFTNAAEASRKAGLSEINAKSSEDNAKTSEINAKASEDNAKVSETNSKTSEENAGTSETNAADSEKKATQAMTDLLAMIGKDIPTLDAGGKIPIDQIPATATQEIFVVESESELTGLNAQRGDLAELIGPVTDQKTRKIDKRILKTWQCLGDPTSLKNWVEWGTSYAVQAGNATNAQNAVDSTMINGHRMVEMSKEQFDTAVKDPTAYYLVHDPRAEV